MRERIALIGATGIGKTALSLELARSDARVALFSCDSMAVYTHMDLGTAKPTPGELGSLKYRLIDLVMPTEEFSVAAFQRHALDAEAELGDEEVALYVGGSGLYHAVIFDALVIPPSDLAVRAALEAELAAVGFVEMYARLAAQDLAAAAKIEANNSRRLIRALEVIEITQRPFSSFGPGMTAYANRGELLFGLDTELAELDLRIEARVHELIEAGWVKECEELAELGELSRSASYAIGYRELFAYLDGEITLEAAIVATIARTRRLVRRQRSWFSRDPRIIWFSEPAKLRDAIYEHLGTP